MDNPMLNGKEYQAPGIYRYLVEVHNIETNKWEIYGSGRTIDEAFEVAEKAVGFSKSHDLISISDPQGFVIWDSEGFRQGEGNKLGELKKIEEGQSWRSSL